MFNKKRNSGNALLPSLIGIFTIGVATYTIVNYLGSSSRLSSKQTASLLAKNYAMELAEYFRSKNAGYLQQNGPDVPLCQPVNFYPVTRNGMGTPTYPDPTADIPKEALGSGTTATRSYSIRVIDLLTMEFNGNLCNQSVRTAVLGTNERYSIDVQVEWRSQTHLAGQASRSTASTVVADISTTPPTIDPCDPNVAGGLITFEKLPNNNAPDAEPGWNGTSYTLPIDTQYKNSHGVTFCKDVNGDKKCDSNDAPIIIGTGTKPTSAPFTAFSCADPRFCGNVLNPRAGWPQDLLLTVYQPLVGSFYAAPGVSDTSPMLIVYDKPVSKASGQLLDVDHVSWTYYTIEAYGANTTTPLTTISINNRQVAVNGFFGETAPTGVGTITPWSLNRGAADIRMIRILSIGAEGAALDNFSPAGNCQYLPPLACDGNVTRASATMVDFEHLPDGRTPEQQAGWSGGAAGKMTLTGSEFQPRSGFTICQEDDVLPLTCSSVNSPVVQRLKGRGPAAIDANGGLYSLIDNNAGAKNHPILITLDTPTDMFSGTINNLDPTRYRYVQFFKGEAFDSAGVRIQNFISDWSPRTMNSPWSFKSLTKNIKTIRLSVNTGNYGIDNLSPTERCGFQYSNGPQMQCDPSVPATGYPSHSTGGYKGFKKGGAAPSVKVVYKSTSQDIMYIGGDFDDYGWRYTNRPGNIDVVSYYDGQEYWPFHAFGLQHSRPSPTFNGAVNAIVSVSTMGGGKSRVYMAGKFTSYTGARNLPEPAPPPVLADHGTYTVNRIARLTFRGYLDSSDSFNTSPGFNNDVNAIALTEEDTTGEIIVGGNFTQSGAVTVNRLARMSFDGGIVSTFGSGFDGNVKAVIVANDNNTNSYPIFAGGEFTTYDGQASKNLVRIDSNNKVPSINAAFKTNIGSGFNDRIQTMAWDKTAQKLWVGGDFITFNGQPNSALIRLNPDGTKDATFQSLGFDDCVWAVALANDGSGDIYAGGKFTRYGAVNSPGLIRLRKDGSVAATFSVGTGFTGPAGRVMVYSIATDCSNDIFVGGEFTAYKGVSRFGFIRLDDQGNPR